MKNYKGERLRVDAMEELPAPAFLAGAGVLKYIMIKYDFCKQARECSNLSEGGAQGETPRFASLTCKSSQSSVNKMDDVGMKAF